MEKFEQNKEMDAGPVGPAVKVQGSFNPPGKSTKKDGLDKAFMGPANTNGPHEVMFGTKGESMLGQKAEIMKEDHSLYMTSKK